MSTPYFVSVSEFFGSWSKDAATLDEAIRIALELKPTLPRYSSLHVYGEGYDCDCDQDGYYMCSDGLTEDERDRVEEAGL